MEGKEELLKLAYKQLDQAAKLLKAAGEEPLAEEAEARVDSSAGAPLFNRKGPAIDAVVFESYGEPPSRTET